MVRRVRTIYFELVCDHLASYIILVYGKQNKNKISGNRRNNVYSVHSVFTFLIAVEIVSRVHSNMYYRVLRPIIANFFAKFTRPAVIRV